MYLNCVEVLTPIVFFISRYTDTWTHVMEDLDTTFHPPVRILTHMLGNNKNAMIFMIASMCHKCIQGEFHKKKPERKRSLNQSAL